MRLWPFAARKLQHIDPVDLEKYGKSAPYTDDLVILQKQMRQTVFVYDDMQKGGRLHEYIAETSLSGRWPTAEAFTVDPFYHWKKDLGKESYSVALSDAVSGFQRNPVSPSRIKGEVYSIRSPQIAKLDFLRENGLQYFRKRVEIYIPHDKVIYSKANPLPALISPKQQVFEAWMYVGNGYYWDDQLAGVIPSSPIPRLKHNREEIGIFSRFKPV